MKYLAVLVLGPTLFSVTASARGGERNVRFTVVDCGPSLVRTLVNTPGLNNQGSLAIWNSTTGASITGIVLRGEQKTSITGEDKFTFVYPSDINDDGTVVGTLQAPEDLRFTHAFKWSAGRMQVLQSLGGLYAEASAINAAGVVAGNAETTTKARHAVMWKDAKVQDLGLLGHGDYSSSRDINDEGDIVGEANVAPNAKPQAFYWHAGTMRQLANLPGGTFCSAQAINNHGVVTGSCDLKDGHPHGVIWTKGVVRDLGTLGDEDSPSTALDINNKNQVVGSSEAEDDKLRAFLWEGGKMTNLNTLVDAKSGWLLLVASRINDRGEIAGRGYFHGGIHAFLLEPAAVSATVSGTKSGKQ